LFAVILLHKNSFCLSAYRNAGIKSWFVFFQLLLFDRVDLANSGHQDLTWKSQNQKRI